MVVLGHRSLTILTRVLYATQRCGSSGLVRPPAQDPRPTYQATDAVVVNQSRYDLYTHFAAGTRSAALVDSLRFAAELLAPTPTAPTAPTAPAMPQTRTAIGLDST